MQLGTLKSGDEAKINAVIANFGKTQPNIMKFSEVMMMLLDRCVFNLKFTFSDFYSIFERAVKVKNKKDLGKDLLQNQRILGREQFIFLLNEIAKTMYKLLPNSQQKFYNQFLSEKFDVDQGQFHSSRVPAFDDINRKLFMEDCISTIIQYQKQLKNIYIMYLSENYFAMKKSRRLLLTERQIALQNKKWNFPSTILYLRESQTTPHLITIDHAEEILRQIVPNINNKQQQFYSKHILVDTYHKQAQGNQKISHPGDPGLYFHEFMLYICRLSWQTFPRQVQKKSTQQVLERYFNYTFFRTNQNIYKTPIPSMNRKMLKKMIEYYKITQNESNQFSKYGKDAQLSEKSPVNILIERINKQVINSPQLGLDFHDIIKNLQKQIPKLSPKPVVIAECPPPYKKADAFTIGQQPPPEPNDKQKGGKAQKKSGGGKKDQIPPRVFPWADVPTTKYAIEDHLKQIEHKIQFQVKPLTDIQRGEIRKQSYPVILGETLFPGQLPKSVVFHLKEASQALNDRNFILALECYQSGLKQWKKSQVQFDAPAELFFQFSKGNVYLSIGKLQHALQAFYNCRKLADTSRLPYINPDRSLPYFGLGEVFFEMEEYQIATRCFLKARQIRQGVLGLQDVQTATVFNNLACCYFMLERAQEALGYIQIAEVVFDTQLGEHHERTMVSRNNLNKISHGSYDHKPQYRRFWEVFEEDKFEKKKKKKAKDAKKK